MDYTAYLTENLPLLLPAGALALTATIWAVRYPKLAMGFLFASLLAGQTVRLPVPGQPAGLLLSDIAVVIVLVSAFFQVRQAHQLMVKGHALLVALFISWSLLSLAINSPRLGLEFSAIAFAYWLRLSAYLLLLPALLLLFKKPAVKQASERYFITTMALLSVLGFLQMYFLPDLSVLNSGWDPHFGRLVSTWYDPNFIGAAFSIALLFFASKLLDAIKEQKQSKASILALTTLLLLLALLLTKSRSSLIALFATGVTYSPVLVVALAKKTVVSRPVVLVNIISVLFLLAVSSYALLGDRAVGLLTWDDTVQARATGYKDAWRLARQNQAIGVGYNAYQYAAMQAGKSSGFSLHSRAGSDSTFLTLIITTGLLGAGLFLCYWLFLARNLLAEWFKTSSFPSLSASAGVVFLLIHSLFVNSFLYGHLLIVLTVTIALCLPSRSYLSP